MATIYIEGKPYKVKDHQNLLHVCLSLGFDLPYFCWHPAMHSVGACRQCAVKLFRDEKDTKGMIVMACMTLAKDGTRISINDPEAKKFRTGITEFMMAPHPHDCPVCDEGGECHLQDMTVMTGHTYRSYRFKKRTHRNQYLGPFIHHEMNRCIACYRCVRFYCDYAGGRDFNVMQCNNRVYFGRQRDGVLESPFSGNLVEICPTGVFTDKTFKTHFTRKWDLQTAPSVCVHCSLGCNTIPGERSGVIRRIRNRYNGEVNGYFLCDRGRYGYEFVNSSKRIREPLLKDGRREVKAASGTAAVQRAASIIRDSHGVIGIGSPRASLESNFALRKLVGSDNFYAGVPEREWRIVRSIFRLMKDSPWKTPSLREISLSDAAFIVGEDLGNTAPIMALTLRQSVLRKEFALAKSLHIEPWDDAAFREAIQQECGPLYIASPGPTFLDCSATRTHRATPGAIVRLSIAVARAIDGSAPSPGDLPEDVRKLAGEIAGALSGAEHPVVISGTSCVSEGVIEAAANVARALWATKGAASLGFAVPECNSMGLAILGGGSLEGAREAIESGRADTAIVLENDLFSRAGEGAIKEILSRARHLVVLDHISSRTTEMAEVILPAATFAGGTGTMVNNEYRAQRFYRVIPPGGEVRESWRWIGDILESLGRVEGSGWKIIDDIVNDIAAEIPDLEKISQAAPPAGYRIAAQKVPRQPRRASGRTSLHANIDVSEPAPIDDPDSPLAFTMEGYPGKPPPSLIPRYWSPGWNSVQAVNKYQQEVAGALGGGDPGIRLIEPAEGAGAGYFRNAPAAERSQPGEWLIVPLYHLFGSEELSMLSPGIARLAPEPYIALNPTEAESLGIREGEKAECEIGGDRLSLPVRHLKGMAMGVAGCPVLPAGMIFAMPCRARLRKAGAP
jgi:NADH-quinone oxidoreductase subunit G